MLPGFPCSDRDSVMVSPRMSYFNRILYHSGELAAGVETQPARPYKQFHFLFRALLKTGPMVATLHRARDEVGKMIRVSGKFVFFILSRCVL